MPTLTDVTTRSRTVLRVDRPDGGRVRVTSAVTGPPERPRLRAMLLDTDVESARVALVPEGALLLAGDAVEVHVEVGDGVRLELVEPSGTVAYAMRGGSATWDVDVRLDAGSALLWHAEPFVVAAGADVRRRTRLVLPEDARLALRETLVLGRDGEVPGTIDSWLVVQRPDGTPVLVERLALGPTTTGALLGGRRVVGSVLGLGVPAPEDSAETLLLEHGGSLTRRLATEAAHALPESAWRAVVARVSALSTGASQNGWSGPGA